MIPADETPSCELVKGDDEDDVPVRYMASLKIPL